MENITLNVVLKLHQETGRGLYSCKVALENSDTYEDAIEYLNQHGVESIYE